jgi:hypothetical protein
VKKVLFILIMVLVFMGCSLPTNDMEMVEVESRGLTVTSDDYDTGLFLEFSPLYIIIENMRPLTFEEFELENTKYIDGVGFVPKFEFKYD